MAVRYFVGNVCDNGQTRVKLVATDPKTVFRSNLRRLAGSHGLDFDGLVKMLGWRCEAKKWLRRAWRDGLARPDSRSEPSLQLLGTAFGIRAIDFWNEDVIPDPQRILHHHNPAFANGRCLIVWSTCVRKILLMVKNLPQVWKDNPNDLLAIRMRYRCEQDMIAAWLASKIGDLRLPPDEQEIVRQALADDTIDHYGGDLSNQLIAHLMKHPRWKEILDKGRQYGDEKHLMRQAALAILEVICRPLTLPEAIARVENHFGIAPTDPQTQLAQILEQLSHHPRWTSEQADYIASRWELAKLHVTPEEFMDWCRNHVLD